MSNNRAQARLEKLRSGLKADRDVADRTKNELQGVAKSSIAQTKRCKSNILGSQEKREKILEESIKQIRRKLTSRLRPSSTAEDALPLTATTPGEFQKKAEALSLTNTKAGESQKKAEALPMTNTKAGNSQKKVSVQAKLVAARKTDKVSPTWKVRDGQEDSSNRMLHPKSDVPLQPRLPTIKTAVAPSSVGLSRSLQKYKIPKEQLTSRLTQKSNQDDPRKRAPSISSKSEKEDVEGNRNIENRSKPQIRATPSLHAGPSKNEQPQPSLAIAPKNPRVQRNLFKRKSSGVASSRRNPCTNSAQQENVKADDTGGVKQFISKVAKSVVGALKQSWASSFGDTSDVSKQLQNVRTLAEQVEVMDYEISCPMFEEVQSEPIQTDLYLVVDTCVIIDNLALIKSLKHKKVKGMTPKIIVPWQVLKELDFLKENSQKMAAVHHNARMGIRFLLDEIVQSAGFVSGQPQNIANRDENFTIEIPDDHLIKCCLQLKWSGHSVALLTDDKNLVVKAVVTEVPAMQSSELIKLMSESNRPSSLTCFEFPPSGSFPQHQLALANASHQSTVLLKNFLAAVLKKYLTLKYQGLWQLKSPGPEPWSLTVLLERAEGYWNELTGTQSDFTASDTISHLRRFITKGTYERVRYPELDQFVRTCHQLAGSLPSTFESERVCIDNHLSFWKVPVGSEPSAELTFVASCVSLTVHHLQLFENQVFHYCHGLSQKFGAPFSYPKVCQAPSSLESINMNLLPGHLSAVETIGTCLETIPTLEEVTRDTETVRMIYNTLISHLGETVDPRFFVDDVFEFCKDSSVRQSIPSALCNLQILRSFLFLIDSRR